MPPPTLQVIAALFPDHDGARRALAAISMAMRTPGCGVLDAVAVTRADTGTLVLLEAAQWIDGSFLVAAPTAAVLELLGCGGGRTEDRSGPSVQAVRPPCSGVPREQLRALGSLLTPAASALVAVVAPLGAAEVAGGLMEEASKLAVEDLPVSAVCEMADRPALLFAPGDPVAAPSGRTRAPHPAFAAYGAAWGRPGSFAGPEVPAGSADGEQGGRDAVAAR